MSRSANENEIASLRRELKRKNQDIALLQQEIHRVWALTPKSYIKLMGVYPPLRKLLHVLAEAADAQDPTRGAPSEDTIRTEVTELTPTERGVLSHMRARNNVRFIQTELDILGRRFTEQLAAKTAHFASVTSATEWEYQPPDGKCDECGKPLSQNAKGRRRLYCSDLCRQRSSRNVTEQIV